jgi:hypothetical protein
LFVTAGSVGNETEPCEDKSGKPCG